MPDSRHEPHAALPVASRNDVIRWLGAVLQGRRIQLTGVLVLFLVEAALALVFPLVMGSFVDLATDGVGPSEFWPPIVVLLITAIVAGLFTWGSGTALAHVMETIIAELREDYVDATLHLPRETVERAGTGDAVTRASEDIAHISGTLPDALPKITISGFTIAFVLAGLASLDPWFLGGFVIVILVHLATLRWYLRAAPPVYASERAAQSIRGQRILGTLTHTPAVIAHGLEQERLSVIGEATWESVRWAMRTRIIQNRLFGRLNFAEAIGLLIVLGTGVWLAAGASITPGEATSAALLFLRTIGPVAALLFVMDEFQSAIAALGRVIGVVVTRADDGRCTGMPPAPVHAPAEPSNRAMLTMEDVSFSFDGRVPAGPPCGSLRVRHSPS